MTTATTATTPTIESWNINLAENFIDNIVWLVSGQKYLLNLNKREPADIIEKYVLEIVEFHTKNCGIVLDMSGTGTGTHYIEFSIFNENNFVIDYEKSRKKYPLLSTMTYLGGGDYAENYLIFTETNLEEYKYKEFKEVEQMLCSIPQKNCHILFDSSKYYGFCGGGGSGSGGSSKPLCLKINLWNVKPSGAINYVATDDTIGWGGVVCGAGSLIFEKQINNICEETLISNKNILEKLLYNNEGREQIKNLDEIINKYIAVGVGAGAGAETMQKNIIRINHKFKNFTFLDLTTKYGKNAEDLKPFISDEGADVAMSENNRFNKNVVIRNLLSKDICYWIINETIKYNRWTVSSVYKNYSANLNVENIPAVLSYVLFVGNFWLQKIKEIYGVPEIDCNIKDIFISKYTKEENVVGVSWNKDNTFLSLNLQLNDGVDFQGGEIKFSGGGDDVCNYCLQQGEALIYNGKKERTNGAVVYGEKYVLVILVELV